LATDCPETQACPAFSPEEFGIMLDRLAGEVLHALSKNPGAVPRLQADVDELLGVVAAWLAEKDSDGLPMSTRVIAAEIEPSELAQTLRELADHLLDMARLIQPMKTGGA